MVEELLNVTSFRGQRNVDIYEIWKSEKYLCKDGYYA